MITQTATISRHARPEGCSRVIPDWLLVFAAWPAMIGSAGEKLAPTRRQQGGVADAMLLQQHSD